MNDGFQELAGADLPSDYGFTGQDGWERAPGNGWESEPSYIHSQTKVSWPCRIRRAFQRFARIFSRH